MIAEKERSCGEDGTLVRFQLTYEPAESAVNREVKSVLQKRSRRHPKSCLRSDQEANDTQLIHTNLAATKYLLYHPTTRPGPAWPYFVLCSARPAYPSRTKADSKNRAAIRSASRSLRTPCSRKWLSFP